MTTTIRISAVGDVLMWHRQIASAKRADGTFSFDAMFRDVAPVLRNADLTIGNLETTLSGREAQYQKRNPKNHFPMFNCPDELAGALKRSGFNVLTTANNHCLDRGERGLLRTLRVLDHYHLAHTGTFRTFDESRRLLIRNVKGIKVGILSYTYGTNGNPIPKGKPYLVNLISTAKMHYDIRRVRSAADLVIVALHFGQEFHRYPNARQKSLVNSAFLYGADVVLGAHPHVLQPMQVRMVKDETGASKKRFVIYSLGNFISDRMFNSLHSDSGVIVNLTVQKNAAGQTSIARIGYVPTWVHRRPIGQRLHFRVVPVRKALSSKDSRFTKRDLQTMQTVLRNTTSHLHL
ncbi:CapA family protein [Alicyclobacillus tolerans]|uniref:CapA family protein n=1 Tax=Alicyclobacillus tolerans TaxID=90970 RepID=UPI001F41CC95|nr:CapA family protein [Alicyclobacillus tolerans]MCF8566249.1 CapA family protein [Alicyclobacillus tolerans]